MIESQPIHDTIQVTKIVVDTIRTSSKDSFELLTKLDTFYNNSWSRLITIVTISFAVIGLLVPFLIQWYQRKELKLSEEKLREEIRLEVKSAISEIQQSFSKSIEDARKEIKEYSDNQYAFTSDKILASAHHVQATGLYDNYPAIAVNQGITAVYYHLKCDDYFNAIKSNTFS